jgi:hypothetical protein
MTHHTMNQMGHQFPNMVGVRSNGLDARVPKLLPGYNMSMGQTGMADMGEMPVPMPANSIPMLGAQRKHDYHSMLMNRLETHTVNNPARLLLQVDQSRIELQVGDAARLEFPTDRFDAADFAILHHVPSWRRAR